ncbi:cytochrome P450 2K1-like isoform X2 [Hippocampus zosterae]|uniref:cytochrome P450 2K1-like isoform X2 n=1 Tax=Hippocampus zosterae TaxID=109293 RepID=UPI00223D10A7|nr:cytochrome P450 2K1-like isoform X2 [Hippocampus zosterae]
MGILDLSLQSGGVLATLLAAAGVLLLVYALSSAWIPQENSNEPPGPRPLPLLGNLLQLDLKRPYNTLVEMSKKYGPVFRVYLGSKKVVVLAGHKVVKEALVNYAEEFGDRDILRIVSQYNNGHGVIWSNGDSWKEMRRFALTNLKDFGMGKKACEDKIIEECQYLLEVVRNFKGNAFDTTQPINYAVSNIITSIVYGDRFNYDDPEFNAMVDGMNRRIQLAGSPSAQVFNLSPWLGKWLPQNKEFFRLTSDYTKTTLEMFSQLRESLNPLLPRSLVDAFFIRKQELEVSSYVLASALALLVGYMAWSSASRSTESGGQEPPGPRPLPLLGNLLQLNLNGPHQTLLQMSKKYGPVFTFYMGPNKVVVLAGYKTVKEALIQHAEEFGEREPLNTAKEVKLEHGVLWNNGESWKEMRRFTLTNLRDFGMGKKACEDKIIEECQHLLEVFKNFRGEAFDTQQPVNYAVSNIICSLVFGSRFRYDDPAFTAMVQRTSRSIQIVGGPSLLLYNMFPWLGKLFSSAREELHNLGKANRKQATELIQALKETFNPQSSRGLVDAFLLRQKQQEDTGDVGHFHNANLLMTVSNLFAAGTETTSTTLRWAFLLMAKYPHIQEKVREELNQVIGDRQVQVEDRKNLPYTDAVIHETQRLANIIPMALPHRTSRDVTFHGYFIKKGTTVYPLLTSVLHDDSVWEKPHSFHPQHFLDKDGKFIKHDAFMPFSAGRRVCLGESLARMELFVFFVTLLQHFRFRPPPGVSEDQLDLTPMVGGTLSPAPHKLRAVSLAG